MQARSCLPDSGNAGIQWVVFSQEKDRQGSYCLKQRVDGLWKDRSRGVSKDVNSTKLMICLDGPLAESFREFAGEYLRLLGQIEGLRKVFSREGLPCLGEKAVNGLVRFLLIVR